MQNNRLDNYLELKEAIVEALRSMPLRGAYIDEQRDLQPHVHEVINSVLNRRFGTQFGCIVSVGAGAPKPNIKNDGHEFLARYWGLGSDFDYSTFFLFG